jgi:hypothetical protein
MISPTKQRRKISDLNISLFKFLNYIKFSWQNPAEKGNLKGKEALDSSPCEPDHYTDLESPNEKFDR